MARQLHWLRLGHQNNESLTIVKSANQRNEVMFTQIKSDSYPVLGVDISSCSKEDFYLSVNERLQNSDEGLSPFFVVTVNPEIAIQSISDNTYRKILQSTSMNTADGIGISWAIKHLYNQSIDRITGSDSFEKICELCAKLDQSVFLFGASPGVAFKAANILVNRNPGLRVQGVYSPETPDVYFEDLPITTQIELQHASVVFVALGAPFQEIWIYENMHHLSRCRMIIGIGGSFDFVAGTQKRAPVLFRRLGMEWVYRLYKEPSRWRRMLRLPLFAINILLLKSSNTELKQPKKLKLNEKEVA